MSLVGAAAESSTLERIGAPPVPSRPLRIGYLALETPIEGQAAYTHVHEIIRGLERRGNHVERFFASRSGASAGHSVLNRLVDYVRSNIQVIRALRRLDVVFVRGHFMAFPAAIVARAFRKIVVHEVNGTTDDLTVTYPWTQRVRYLIEWLQLIQLRTANAIFAVTPGLRSWASSAAKHDRVFLVPNAANTALFRPDGPTFVTDRPYVVFVGGLVRWHGIGTMLKALRHQAWPAGVDLVVAGDGIERKLLAEAEEREPRLRWLRHLRYESVPDLLRGATAALVPIEDPAGRSSRGVLPLKLYEAMACGVPVIVTDLPGQGDLVREEKAGLVIRPGDPAALAQAIALIVHDRELAQRMGANGARAARERHSWQQRADAINEVLIGCAQQRFAS